MSVIKCKECGSEVSEKAKTCPKCGEEPMDTYSRIVGFLVPFSAYSKERKQEFEQRKWFDLNEN